MRRRVLQPLLCACTCRAAPRAFQQAASSSSSYLAVPRRRLHTSNPTLEQLQEAAGGSSSSSSSPSANTARYTQDQEHADEEDLLPDYHDKWHARKLTHALVKRKKRIVKRGQDFVDKVTVQVSAGGGGDGGVAFHTEKFVPNGGPSGGNGGQGGNVYIRPVTHLSSLSTLQKKMSAHRGTPGQGSWMHGRRGKDLVIEVPYGTIVKEKRSFSEEEADAEEEEETLNLSWNEWRRKMKEEVRDDPEAAKERRRKFFVLFPTVKEDAELLEAKQISELEMSLLEDERRQLYHRLRRDPLEIDFDQPPEEHPETKPSDDATIQEVDNKILIARGGAGGYGNPYFTSTVNRNPRFATRGRPGESMRLEFELKTLADVGLVGLPNAGKSTLLRALTHSRTTVASYAFTTINPQIGTLIVYDDASYSTISATQPIEDSNSPSLPDLQPRDRKTRPSDKHARQEILRLKISDCPGILPLAAAENFGLGHAFLRHIERSKVLIYIVDLSSRNPTKDLIALKNELEIYKPGLNQRARIIIANKADKSDAPTSSNPLCLGDGQGQSSPAETTTLTPEQRENEVAKMRTKLAMLRNEVQKWKDGPEGDGVGGDGLDRVVIPVSAKMRGNIKTVVESLIRFFPKDEGSRRVKEDGQQADTV